MAKILLTVVIETLLGTPNIETNNSAIQLIYHDCKKYPLRVVCHDITIQSRTNSMPFILANTAKQVVTRRPNRKLPCARALWRNGSASDSRSDGWEFKSLWGQGFTTTVEEIPCYALYNLNSAIPMQ